jgi:predicted PurR-regulated permease PerM
VGRISTSTTLFVLIVVALLAYQIRWVLAPFILAGLVAYICTPIVDWLATSMRVPRLLSAILVFAALIGIGIGFGGIVGPPLMRDLVGVVADLQGTLERFARAAIGNGTVAVFGEPMNAAQLAQAATGAMRDWIAQPGRAVMLAGLAFANMFGVILVLVLLFYFLAGGPEIMLGLLRLAPPEQRPLLRHIWANVDPVLRRYFLGVICVVTYAAIAAYIGLGLVLGIHGAVFLALLTGVLEMIPLIGPGASAVIAGLVAVRSATSIGPIIAYALYATCLRLSIDQLFGPIALGTAARLHPVVIIFCFLAGGVLFGIIGVILAIPVALIVKTTLTIRYDEAGAARPAAGQRP